MPETATWWRALLPHGRGLADDAWQRRHAILSAVVMVHVPILFSLAVYLGFSPLHAAWEVAGLVAAALIGRWPALPRPVREISVSVGLLAASAMLVHISGGMIEAHFHFFAMLPLVAMYQRWAPFLFAVGFVLIHHGIVGVLDPQAVYNHPSAQADPWTWAAIHAFFVTLECLALFRLWREVEDSQDAVDAARESASRLLEVQVVKERLLRLASHELSTPLTPIKLQLSLMAEESVRSDPARRDQALAVLERNFGRLERIIASVLDAVRVDNDHIRLHIAHQDVARVARDAASAYTEVARARGVTLAADLQSVHADVDAERIAQVIDNLLSNAIKYTPAGGHVVLRVRDDAGALIEVQDDGQGLLADQVARLFQPFGMVHAAEDSAQGTGLGLYICKGIVESHGGSMGAASDGPGRGTRFWARLPPARVLHRLHPRRSCSRRAHCTPPRESERQQKDGRGAPPRPLARIAAPRWPPAPAVGSTLSASPPPPQAPSAVRCRTAALLRPWRCARPCRAPTSAEPPQPPNNGAPGARRPPPRRRGLPGPAPQRFHRSGPGRRVAKAVLLLSGGIDSPVAGRMLQDQGVELEAIHCSFEPLTDDRSVEKAKDLAGMMRLDRLHVARIGEALARIPQDRDAHRYYFVLQKRMFYRLAQQVAADVGATMIATGENLGQVSSQTLHNLASIEAVATLPVVRPLLGLDKMEIVSWARDYGTLETSTGPELCDLLGPDKPATVSDPGRLVGFEEKLGLLDLPPITVEMLASA